MNEIRRLLDYVVKTLDCASDSNDMELVRELTHELAIMERFVAEAPSYATDYILDAICGKEVKNEP